MKLNEKVAIVTGGGRGIGRAIALGFAREGANVVIASRTESKIEEVAEEIRKLGRRSLAIKTDVCKEEDVKNMLEKALEEFSHIDILVNNAGIGMTLAAGGPRRIKDLETEIWDEIIDTNLRGPFLCAKYVLETMEAQRSGSIINISGAGITKEGKGIMSRNSGAGYAPYGVSKFGLERLTQILASEMEDFNVAVNTLRPGRQVDTDLNRGMPRRAENLLKPEVLVPSAVFLATQDAKGVTGESINALKWNEEHGIDQTLEP